MQTMRHLLLVSSVDSGATAGTAIGRCHRVIFHQETELDCR
jgi:hypothetical protein